MPPLPSQALPTKAEAAAAAAEAKEEEEDDLDKLLSA